MTLLLEQMGITVEEEDKDNDNKDNANNDLAP